MQSDPGIITVGFGPGLAAPLDMFEDARDLRGTNDIASADVVVLQAGRPPAAPVQGSVLLVGDPADRHPDWARTRVDSWWIDHAEPTAAAIRRAWAEGVLRPPRTPLLEEWLAAARAIASADVCAVVHTTGADWCSGADDVAATFGATERGALLASLRRHGTVALSGTATFDRIDWRGSPLDAVLAVPAGRRASDGAILLGVREGGARWLPLAVPAAHRLADSWMRRAAEARVDEVESQLAMLDRLLRRVISIVSHDLRNPLFAIQLGIKVLERQHGASDAVASLNRSVGVASSILKRVVDATRAVIDVPTIAPVVEGASVGDACDRVLAALEAPPERVDLSQVDRGARVEVEQGTLERLLEPLLSNALQHGAPDRNVTVSTSRADGEVTIDITNAGTLPFAAVDRLEAFEHRSGGGFGVGIVIARRLAQISGVALDLRQDGPLVRARLRMPAARGKVVAGGY
jgi:signal transduction histidine kinase